MNQNLNSRGSFPEGKIVVLDIKLNKILAFWQFSVYSLFNQCLSVVCKALCIGAKETGAKVLA